MSNSIHNTNRGLIAISDHLTKTFSYYAAFIALGLVNASLGPTLPGLAALTGTQISEIGFLFTARSLGYLLGSMLGGRLYDRHPGHRIMGSVIILVTITMMITPTIPLLWLLMVILLITGMAVGTLDVGGNTLIVWTHREKVGPFMNALHFFFGVGAFLAPIIVAQALLRDGGILAAYWVLGLLVLPVGLWFLRLPNSPRQVTDTEHPVGSTSALLVFLVALFFFLYVGVEIGFSGWIFTYALNTGLATEAGAAYLNAGFWGAFTVGRLLSIPVATRLAARQILVSGLSGGGLSLGLMLLAPNSLIVAWLGTLGLGLSLAAIFPTMLSFAERRMVINGRVTGWFFVGASTGAMTWPWLFGQLFEKVGPQTMLWVMILNLLVGIGVFAMMLIYSKRVGHQTTVNTGLNTL